MREKEKKESPNVTKVKSYVMSVLHNVRMKLSNVRKKKKKEPPNVTKVLSNVMLVLSKVTMEPLNVRKKNKRTTKCDKSTITHDVSTAQCEDGIIKYEKKKREPPNVTKVLSNVMLELHNMRIEPSNVRKKNEGTTKCEKRTVICDIRTTQYEDETIKCDVLIIWYSRLSTSGYRTPQKMGYSRITLQNYYSSSYS